MDLRIRFSAAPKANTTKFMIVHNHPSGNIQPSEADKNLTKEIREAVELVDINYRIT